MSRWKAMLIHLGISALIGTAVIAALLLIWYPPPQFSAAGVERFIYLLIGVDVVLGPLLTLVVFRLGKPGLKLDLTLIALCQLAALIYGLHIMWQSRPVYLVAVVDRIHMVTPIDIDQESLAKAEPPYANLPVFGPQLIGGRTATDPEERHRMVMLTLQTGKDVQNLPEYFVPYDQVSDQLLQRSRPLQTLLEHYPQHASRVRDFLAQQGGTIENLRFVPFTTPHIDISAVLDGSNAQVLGYIDLDPWFVPGAEQAGRENKSDAK